MSALLWNCSYELYFLTLVGAELYRMLLWVVLKGINEGLILLYMTFQLEASSALLQQRLVQEVIITLSTNSKQ